MTDAIGTIGAVMLALCGLPQTVKTIREGHAFDVSLWFLLMWLFGEILMCVYVVETSNDTLLLLNYGVNCTLVAPVVWYKLKPRKGRK